ncbi:hypothetical protein OE88DRAFT_1628795 [Heliocybe sulcata]|uniref:Integrase core domain-containing protein n=1 Tax=Heliocybe sulcata TaxID=5364 RepID=A0A5C3N3V6_9AGAM|nr:hypothetical protein OE88DRAFT_1628795 [Heliocybe sulcata]
MGGNNNPDGKNQFSNCPAKDDKKVEELLRQYHQEGISNRRTISAMLREEGIIMGEKTVDRRRKAFGLFSSGLQTKLLHESERRQLIVDQMAKDPTSRQGPMTVKEGVAYDNGIHLTRAVIINEMRALDPKGFEIRDPTAKKVHRVPVVCLGPNHKWTGDGHDKLAEIGFPIWGMRDVWSGKWLGLWVVPSNRYKVTVAYLYLCLVETYGGIPIQSTTDCGSETTRVYGFANALREAFAPELPISELPAHRFLKSIHNTPMERGWLRLRLQWGDNVKVFWEAGAHLYNSDDPRQRYVELVHWLWPTLIQKELDYLRKRLNGHKIRYDKNKILPSGASPNTMMKLHTRYGGEDGLIPVDLGLIGQLKEELGGPGLTQFVDTPYAERALEVFQSLNVEKLTFQNVWEVYKAMMPLMYPTY